MRSIEKMVDNMFRRYPPPIIATTSRRPNEHKAAARPKSRLDVLESMWSTCLVGGRVWGPLRFISCCNPLVYMDESCGCWSKQLRPDEDVI